MAIILLPVQRRMQMMCQGDGIYRYYTGREEEEPSDPTISLHVGHPEFLARFSTCALLFFSKYVTKV